MPTSPLAPDGYADLLSDLKARVRATQFRAARAANTEVLRLYWSIGKDILERQVRDGWGSKVIERLAADLRREFPDQRGWSTTNLKYMRMVAEAWPTPEAFGQQAADQLPWGHVQLLIDKLDTRAERDWYAARAVENGWSRNVLLHQITFNLRAREGAAPSNFAGALDPSDSELAQQLVKDPYVFDHLRYAASGLERDVEQALTDRIQATLLEFGRGMALVGRQFRLPLGDGTEYVIDLLLFHVEQLRYVVVELKVTDFEPGYLGQLGAYVAAVDGELRRPEVHAPTVGILLCTGRSEPSVRYSLGASAVPLAVADYRGLPDEARAALPSAEELQAVITAELESRAAEPAT